MQVAVVDDTQLNLTLIGKLVDRTPNARAHNFERPTPALEWCLANAPDLIIVYYMMPEMDGLEFIRRIRAHRDRDDLPILMVTASHERDVRYAALDCGASDFLTKPIDAREFEARVRNMLKLREAHLAGKHRAETLAAEVRRQRPTSSTASARPSPGCHAPPSSATPRPAPTSSACRIFPP